ncbi:MAG: radical SAM family heme chaperone HemW [Chloroflexi bacterium]|nr:radical SAM family heme chaperone HemW [Chloroflexota bacterium]
MIGLYIHIPFCEKKCGYCDFNSMAGMKPLHNRYVQALLAEISARARLVEEHSPLVGSIYFGGGTPTILEPVDLVRILREVSDGWDISSVAEITVEANPGSVDLESLRVLRQAGFNRVSLGVQSFDDNQLRELGRIHSARQAGEAIAASRQAGFTNVSIDLMFGLPNQSVVDFGRDIQMAITHRPDHLSLYALTIEEGTPFGERARQGRLAPPPEDDVADMYCLAEEVLESAGYCHYEISNWAGRCDARGGGSDIPSGDAGALENWAKRDPRSNSSNGWQYCRHNLVYWRCGEYIGLGAGAHSYWQGVRFSNETLPKEYIKKVEEGRLPVLESESLSPATQISEYMMLGLRTAEGVRRESFAVRFGRRLDDTFGSQVETLCELGLLEDSESGIWLSPRGRLLGNEVFVRFILSVD